MIKKNVIAIMCVIAIVVGMLKICEQPLRPINTDTTVNSISKLNSFPENTMDLMVFGSSHAWCGIDTELLYEKYDVECYNYGCAWQHVNTTELFLKNALRTQSPKVVVLDTDMLYGVLKDTDMNGEIFFSKQVGDTNSKLQYLKDCFGNKPVRYISYLFPAIMFHSNWTELTEENFMENANSHDFVKTRGYLGTDSIEAISFNYKNYNQVDISDEAKYYLDRMVKLCRDNNIRVILCTIPYGKYDENLCYTDSIKEYSDKMGIEYINYFELTEELGINSEKDYRNVEHLNNSGAIKATEYLAKYLEIS